MPNPKPKTPLADAFSPIYKSFPMYYSPSRPYLSKYTLGSILFPSDTDYTKPINMIQTGISVSTKGISLIYSLKNI